VSVAARRVALVSRSVVRLAVVVVLLQDARRVTARRPAAIFVIILVLVWCLAGITPDGLYNYNNLGPIGK